MPELTEEQIRELTESAQTSKALRSEIDSLKQSHEQQIQNLAQSYQRDLGNLATYAQAVVSAGQPQPQDTDEPLTEIKPSKLRQMMEQASATQIAPVLQQYYVNTRDANRRLAKREHAEMFSKYGREIEAIVDAQSPDIAAQAGAYDAAVQLVWLKHKDEELEAEVSKRLAAKQPPKPTPGDDDEVEDGEQVEDEVAAAPQTTSGKVGAIVPTGSAVGATHQIRQRREKVVPLNRQERFYAEKFGLTTDEYRKYDQVDTEDVFGFRDKQGKIRRSV